MGAHLHGQRPAEALFREISSCALHTELARMARSWQINAINGAVTERDVIRASTKDSFKSVVAGGQLKPGRAKRLQNTFQSSHLLLWLEHPLARVLCDSNLQHNELLKFLEAVPGARLRSVVLRDTFVPAGGIRIRRPAPWSEQLIQALVESGKPTALFALAVMYRLRQLEGDVSLSAAAAQGLWHLLPMAIRRSRHLRLAGPALIVAMDVFLSRQPWADALLWELGGDRSLLGRRDAVASIDETWSADKSIPATVRASRRAKVSSVLVSDVPHEPGWWGLFQSPSDICDFLPFGKVDGAECSPARRTE